MPKGRSRKALFVENVHPDFINEAAMQVSFTLFSQLISIAMRLTVLLTMRHSCPTERAAIGQY